MVVGGGRKEYLKTLFIFPAHQPIITPRKSRASKGGRALTASGNIMAEIRSLDLRKKPAGSKDEPKEETKEEIKAESKNEEKDEPKTESKKEAVQEPEKKLDSTDEQDRPRTTGPLSRRRRTPQKPAPRSDSRKPPVKTERKATRAPAKRKPPARPKAPAAPKTPSRPSVTTPVIGIVGSFMRFNKKDHHDCEYHYVYHPYIEAIHKAGGTPVIIPVGLEGRYPNKVFELINGLMLIGGGDIDPNLYGDLLTSKLWHVEPKKDRTEIDLFNLAFNKNIPIFGICRGIQLINVALDGTLYQDITSQVRMAIAHKPDIPWEEPSHAIRIETDSKLYRALGEKEIWVNSAHHQSIKLHGKGLISTAKASDGIIEAIEHPNKKWVVGVQWHPELFWENDKIQAKLFKAFVDACKS